MSKRIITSFFHQCKPGRGDLGIHVDRNDKKVGVLSSFGELELFFYYKGNYKKVIISCLGWCLIYFSQIISYKNCTPFFSKNVYSFSFFFKYLKNWDNNLMKYKYMPMGQPQINSGCPKMIVCTLQQSCQPNSSKKCNIHDKIV